MAFAVLDVADPVDAASVCGAEFAATGAAGVAATGGTELAAAGAAGVVAACAPVSTVGFAAGDPTGLPAGDPAGWPANGGAAGKPLVASDWVSVRSAIRLCVSFSRSAVVVARVGGGGTVARVGGARGSPAAKFWVNGAVSGSGSFRATPVSDRYSWIGLHPTRPIANANPAKTNPACPAAGQ